MEPVLSIVAMQCFRDLVQQIPPMSISRSKTDRTLARSMSGCVEHVNLTSLLMLFINYYLNRVNIVIEKLYH